MVSKLEIGKDTAQVVVESAATHVGRIASIITGAVREVTQELGDWASDVFEMREAAGRAADDARRVDVGVAERREAAGL
ncbi:hypothetical protein [Jatrophihabitans fulvus]